MSLKYNNEEEYIRELAGKVAEAALGKGNLEIHKRWHDVNALRKPDRPPVFCRPIGAWNEMLPPEKLFCKDPELREIEIEFRRALIKNEIGDDTPLEDYYPVQAVFDVTPENMWGVDIKKTKPEKFNGAWRIESVLKSGEDFDRLKTPEFKYNRKKTQDRLERQGDLFGDILPPRLVCNHPLSATLGLYAADLRGLEEMMMDTVVNPGLLHRLMVYLRDCVLGAMRQVEDTGLLTPNNTGGMTCSDFFGPEPRNGKITYKNCWEMANSQEFDMISPKMWEEFCLDYQKPIFEKFGYIGYGCCENLTHKIGGVLSIPNLRIFVCSAWTDLQKVADSVGDKYVIMWRQKASDVVFASDAKKLEYDLAEGVKKLQGCYAQIVLREIETLAGNPDRLHVWTEIAKEVAARYA